MEPLNTAVIFYGRSHITITSVGGARALRYWIHFYYSITVLFLIKGICISIMAISLNGFGLSVIVGHLGHGREVIIPCWYKKKCGRQWPTWPTGVSRKKQKTEGIDGEHVVNGHGPVQNRATVPIMPGHMTKFAPKNFLCGLSVIKCGQSAVTEIHGKARTFLDTSGFKIGWSVKSSGLGQSMTVHRFCHQRLNVHKHGHQLAKITRTSNCTMYV